MLLKLATCCYDSVLSLSDISGNWPISQIIHHICNRNAYKCAHISVIKRCTVGYGTSALWDLWNWAPSQYPKRRLIVRSREVSKPRDWYFKLSCRFEIWQARRQQCCRSACQIPERSDNSKYKSRGFETLRDLTIRRLFGYWDGAQVYWIHVSRMLDPIFAQPFQELCRHDAQALRWRHNGCDGVSNRRHFDCLLNCLFRCRSEKTSKLRVTGLSEGNSPVTGEFPHKGPVTRKIFPFDDVIVGREALLLTWRVRNQVHVNSWKQNDWELFSL